MLSAPLAPDPHRWLVLVRHTVESCSLFMKRGPNDASGEQRQCVALHASTARHLYPLGVFFFNVEYTLPVLL